MTLSNSKKIERLEPAAERLREKTDQLVSGFAKKKSPDFIKRYAQVLDDYFFESFESSRVGPEMGMEKNPYAIIALGGYGRKEQFIHSDVDLLFLFEKYVPDKAEVLIQEIVYPLWDIGLEVGHATRSLKECVKLAIDDIEVLTSILDARFVCGMSLLYSSLMEHLRKRFKKRHSTKAIKKLVDISQSRHECFGDSSYLLEPNLKEGQGGLRDYHTMLWIARLKSNLKQFRDLEYYGFLSHDEFQATRQALEFISNVRNCLHHLSGRKCDQLYFEYQIKMADALKFGKKNGQQPVERFLSKLHSQMEFLKQQHLMFLYELGLFKNVKRSRKALKHTLIKGLEIMENGMINFVSSEDILRDPNLLIKIFEESATLKIPLSAEAKRLVREFSFLVDKEFSSSVLNLESFERILAKPSLTFNVLNEMLNSGFLIRFIPEFKKISDRIQYDEYHLYPVDRHSLRTVQNIKRFGTSEGISKYPLCSDIYKRLKKRHLLLWAALLHDIGKGETGVSHSIGGAEIASSILIKKGYLAEDVETVSFLIKEHLLLIKTATRRDLNDEETAILCARKIKDIGRLKMLYLLTVADSMATGPKAWSDWTAALLRDLFFKVSNVLKKGELATREAVEAVEKKKTEVFGSAIKHYAENDMETLFNFMSLRYLLYTTSESIMEHIELYKNVETEDFVWNVTKTPDSNTRTVTICAQDRPGLFSKIAGTFTLNGLDILDAQIFTWRNNIALDIFEVNPPLDQIFEKQRWQQAEVHLKSALSGDLDLKTALEERITVYRPAKLYVKDRPHQINVDNDSSSFFTIIEVFTYDFPGLLYTITDALFRCGLDIWVAKIATKVDQVVDVFYVRDFDGQKVDSPDQVEKIKTSIKEVLPGFKT
ncbi:MAG: [protein-PII] uridylyltransferase [Deltaproteobacteria bacterium]|nr:[protein-PII] uridylyltransferase [Deltaproteobacteria bacterium]